MLPTVEVVVALAVVTGVVLWQVVSVLRKQMTGSIIHSIPGPPPRSFWTGNMKELNERGAMTFHEHIATQYGSVVKLNGFAGRPVLYVKDPKALHHVLIKEEPNYQESPEFTASFMVYFGPGLLSTLGHAHTKQRKIMNPVFSVNHMRYMTPLFFDIGYKLRAAIAERLSDGPRDIDIMDWMGRIALELIGQGGLGYSFHSLVRDTKDEYAEALRDFTPLLSSLSMFRRLIPHATQLLPMPLLRIIVSVFPMQTRVQKLKKVVDTMYARAGGIYLDKKRAFAKGDTEVVQQVQRGKDILSILMRANSAMDEKDRLTEEEVVAQMTTLLFAANDTTSNTLSRILYLLSQNQDVQSRLRQELLDTRAAEGISYDELNRLPVLDSVCRETLRRYPPINLLLREAVADTVLPLGEPVEMRDGSKLTEIPIPKGTEMLIGFLGCNVNKNMWGDDALEWKPDRWLKGVPEAVTEARIPGVYSNIMSFSGGKRACIGFKFSEIEMKVVLSVIVSTFVLKPSEKPVCWNMGGPVTFPTVGWESIKPEMYLKMSLYDPVDKPRVEV